MSRHLFDVIYFASANRVRANDQQQMRMMAFQNFMEQFKLASGPKMISKGSSKGDIKFSNVGPTSHESSVPKLVTINICVKTNHLLRPMPSLHKDNLDAHFPFRKEGFFLYSNCNFIVSKPR